ncbi:MAG: ATP-binding cassette domain-containing protein [Myxococcales bacterium]|nr:ATP-binding cassette domain-containing protein [Myxococcales bacterium]
MSAAARDRAIDALQLRRFGVAFGKHVVLSNVTLDVPARGVVILVGPASTGKSTLLRTLAGLNDRQPALRTWGLALYAGHPLAGAPRPAMVLQDARQLISSVRENLYSALPDRAALSRPQQHAHVSRVLDALGQKDLLERLDAPALELSLADQRRLAIARAALGEASCILIDEPTAGVDDEDAGALLLLMRLLSEERALVVCTHHRGHARALGGRVALLAGGRIEESGDTLEFLDGPQTEAGRAWLATGHCAVPSPSALAEELAEGVARPTPLPISTQIRLNAAREPRGFFWLVEGQLAGMPRPGIVAELDDDLDGVRGLGVDVLITLEETATVPREALDARGIRNELFPIPDMEAPSLDRAAALCARIDGLLAEGRVVAVHCLAGLGRTGTVLAAYAIWRGAGAVDAIDTVRGLRPRTIQSEAQARFLERFAERCQDDASRRMSRPEARTPTQE